MGALTGARRVHLATHGRHRAAAPSFQALFVAPGKGGDGVLHDYELLGLDLRGLELVTLSACETALGRVDPSDNIRGLPATLLTAGTRSIVGALWEVMTACAEAFFTALYGRVRNGVGILDAFATAQ